MEINKSDRFAWFSRGKILASFGKLDSSLACFDRAITLEPNYYEAWSEKGSVYEQLGLPEKAEFCFNQALGAFCSELSETLKNDLTVFATPEDNSPSGCYNQACFHAIQGHTEAAIVYLEKAISADRSKYTIMALQDEDFELIADDSRFQELTSIHLRQVSCPII